MALEDDGREGLHGNLQEEKEEVNHPAHYNQGGIECIEAIRAALTPEEFRGFCKGNALKYIWRERHKNRDIDLGKANWYLDELYPKVKE